LIFDLLAGAFGICGLGVVFGCLALGFGVGVWVLWLRGLSIGFGFWFLALGFGFWVLGLWTFCF